MATQKEKELLIESKLKSREVIMKSKNDFSREDIQLAINSILYDCESLDELKKSLEDVIKRTGIKKVGFKTTYTPREGLVEGEKTFGFLSDILTYIGVTKRFNISTPKPTNKYEPR